MYTIRATDEFEAALKRCKQEGRDLRIFQDALELLAEDGRLPAEYRPHLLIGEYAGCWECHLEEDWLLIWKQNNKRLTLLLTNTGTHKELFHKKEMK